MSVSELYKEAKPLGMDGALRSQTPRAQRNRNTARAAQPKHRGFAALPNETSQNPSLNPHGITRHGSGLRRMENGLGGMGARHEGARSRMVPF